MDARMNCDTFKNTPRFHHQIFFPHLNARKTQISSPEAERCYNSPHLYSGCCLGIVPSTMFDFFLFGGVNNFPIGLVFI